jgi:hypothetical protein
MGIKRRLTADIKLVSQFDEAFATYVPEDIQEKYNQRWNIEELGDLSQYKEQPSVFTCRPLMAKHEHFINPPWTDYWGIFANHVRSVTGLDFEIEWDGKVMAPSMQDAFPRDIVVNIASMIEKLGSTSGHDSFFTVPVGFLAFREACKRHLVVSQAKASARMGAAIIKNS